VRAAEKIDASRGGRDSLSLQHAAPKRCSPQSRLARSRPFTVLTKPGSPTFSLSIWTSTRASPLPYDPGSSEVVFVWSCRKRAGSVRPRSHLPGTALACRAPSPGSHLFNLHPENSEVSPIPHASWLGAP